MMKKIRTEQPELRDKLFARGFLFTNETVDSEAYPFYDLWKKVNICGATLLVSHQQSLYIHRSGEYTMILVGHAYDPFSMEADENRLLETLCTALQHTFSAFTEKLNQLTGVFTLIWMTEKTVYVVGDATGMQTTFYTNIGSKYFVSSHTNLIGDILELDWSSYVTHLAKYKFFPLLGNSLPGDLTQFERVKRLVPNHYISFENENWTSKRFYWPAQLQIDRGEIPGKCADILHRNLELIAQKWEKPAISMTGGCDSKTTLACANGLYDRFSYFSYRSSDAEEVDAVAAKKICNALGLSHKTYVIPENDCDVDGTDTVRELLNWNTGGLRKSNANDVRKRAYFTQCSDFDVEVKSWASEVGRAYYSKRFHGRKNFGKKPTPRACTTLYKFFLHDRKLVRETDQVFAEYLAQFFEAAADHSLPWQEQFFWEFRMPSLNGLVITGEHRYSYDITIPYNNRKLLELLLSAPIEDRIGDTVYQEIREYMNPTIDQTGIAVTNLKHTERRAKFEDIYWCVHSKFPF